MEMIMKRAYRKSLFAAMALAFAIGATFTNASANNCRFAYNFCMPRYYTCLASGTWQYECHAELDACILRNGCSTLP
jgi:hypothetical protein